MLRIKKNDIPYPFVKIQITGSCVKVSFSSTNANFPEDGNNVSIYLLCLDISEQQSIDKL